MSVMRCFLITFGVLLVFMVNSVDAQRTCFTCDSRVDPNCATLQLPLDEPQSCALETDECVIAVVSQTTLRGCRAEIAPICQGAGEDCLICSTDNCNNIVYPFDRLRCHTCTNCPAIRDDSSLAACENYLIDDSCFVYTEKIISDGVETTFHRRGCYSSFSNEEIIKCNEVESTSQCFKCEGRGCNDQSIPQNTQLSCIQCTSLDDLSCFYEPSDENSKPCSYEVVDDQPEYCYTMLEDGVISKGCLANSETSESIKNSCDTNDPRCTKCEGSNCNGSYGTCIVCDGKEDNNNCSKLSGDNLEQVQLKTCSKPNGEEDDCFISLIDGIVTRGCVSDLQPQQLNQCLQSSFCKICQGPNCNKDNYQSCYACNTKIDHPYCSGNATLETPSKICDAFPGTCQTRLDPETGTVIRGCTGELPPVTECSEPYCTSCSEDNCNGLTYPTDRIYCHQCIGEECIDVSSNAYLEACRFYDKNDFCYTLGVFTEEISHIQRGCGTDIDGGVQLCSDHSEKCEICINDGCNNQSLKVPSKLECIKCSTETDPNCYQSQWLAEGYQCEYDVMPNDPDFCYTFQHIDGTVSRGCLYEAPEDIQTKCLQNHPDCQNCTEPLCNTDLVEDFGRCFYCTDCETVDGLEPINCPEGDHRGCFRTEVDVLARGCVSHLTESEYENCQNNNNKCKICDEDLCNQKPDFQRCHICNSTDDNRCNEEQDKDSYGLCNDYIDKCIILIESGETKRGCQEELDPFGDCTDPKRCLVCDGNYCNKEVFPNDRQYCNKCSGKDGDCMANLTQEIMFRQPCPNYSDSDGCYSVLATNETIYRGCLSDTDPAHRLCENMKDDCLKCSGHNCNVKVGRRSPYFYCTKCTADDPHCGWGLQYYNVSICERDVLLSETESCYEMLDEFGNGIRGCTLDDDLSCSHTPYCSTCSVTTCNLQTLKYHLCYQCDSSIDSRCNNEVKDLGTSPCHSYHQKLYDTGCYMQRRPDDTVYRGCLVDLDSIDRNICEQGLNGCTSCFSEGCNDAPGFALTLHINIYLILFSIIYLLLTQ